MKKLLLIVFSLLMTSIITYSQKSIFTYNLVQTSPQSVIEDQKNYAFPGTDYNYIINIPNYNGFAKGTFKIELTNGKFSDNSTTKTVENATPFLVKWDDIPNLNARVKIIEAISYNPAVDSLKKGIGEISYLKIASLKGVSPSVYFTGYNTPLKSCHWVSLIKTINFTHHDNKKETHSSLQSPGGHRGNQGSSNA